jgi:integrase
VRKYLIPGVGKIKLAEITAQDLDDLYADMEEKGVGERTARYVHQVISSALERAARKHLVPFNLVRYADPPPMPQSEGQFALTLQELSRFFESAAGTRFENYFIVSALCGARPREILGHSRIDQTMNTYAHVMPHIQADAFGRFSKRFSQG